MNLEDIQKIVGKHNEQQDGLISILEDIQSEYNYLPPDALRIVANITGRSLVDIYGIATFYKSFSLTPRGRHLITVCMGTACHVRAAATILDEMQRKLQIKPGETTEDNEFTLETVNCLGACALGPIVVVDDEYNGQMTIAKVGSMLKKLMKKVRGK